MQIASGSVFIKRYMCSQFNINESVIIKGVFKGGVQGVQTPPKFSDIFLKIEGKEIERKRKKRDVGGGGVTS